MGGPKFQKKRKMKPQIWGSEVAFGEQKLHIWECDVAFEDALSQGSKKKNWFLNSFMQIFGVILDQIFWYNQNWYLFWCQNA